MFFLLRVAFWLTVVLVLLPSGGSQKPKESQFGAADAVVAATAAVSDMSKICDRQPDACTAGSNAAVAIGQRAQAGARMVYEFITDRIVHSDATPARTVPVHPGSQSTLRPDDLEPAWRGPSPLINGVPLPRPRKEPRHPA